jgi:hypothetical protein
MKISTAKFVTVILALFSSATFVCVTYRNFPFDRELTVILPIKNERQISRLGPEPRVRISGSEQAIVEGPVYFDIRVLPWFRAAKIEIVYKENGQAFDGIAVQSAAGWNYDLIKPYSVEELDDGWSKATIDFDLSGGYQVRNVRRFLIGTQQTNPDARGELTLRELSVKLFW